MQNTTIQLAPKDLSGVFGGCDEFTATEFTNCFTVTGFKRLFPPNLTITVAKNYPASRISASVVTSLSDLFKPVKTIVKQISRNLEIPLAGRYDDYGVQCLVGYFAFAEDFDLGVCDTVFTYDTNNSHLKNSALLCRRNIAKSSVNDWVNYLRATEKPKFMGIGESFSEDHVVFYWSSTYSHIFDDPEVLLARLVSDSLQNSVYEIIQIK